MNEEVPPVFAGGSASSCTDRCSGVTVHLSGFGAVCVPSLNKTLLVSLARTFYLPVVLIVPTPSEEVKREHRKCPVISHGGPLQCFHSRFEFIFSNVFKSIFKCWRKIEETRAPTIQRPIGEILCWEQITSNYDSAPSGVCINWLLLLFPCPFTWCPVSYSLSLCWDLWS